MPKSIIFILILLNILTVLAQELTVPIDLQMKIFEKIISLEKGISEKITVKQKIEILVLYQNRYRSSLNVKDNINQYFKNNNKLNIKITNLNLEDDNDLDNYLKINKTDILILSPLRAIDIQHISETAKNYRILSFSTIHDNVRDGISIGIDNVGDKSQIIINLQQSKNEGAKFSSHLLKLALIYER